MLDGLPERTRFTDDGCDIAPRCLECPLPACRYDLPPKVAGALLREAELRQLLISGLSVPAAATAMGVSRRTGFRLRNSMGRHAAQGLEVVSASIPAS